MSARVDLPPTLAALVRQLLPGTSWEQARALCRTGRVAVAGSPWLDPAARPRLGSTVQILPPGARHAAGNTGQAGPGGAGSRSTDAAGAVAVVAAEDAVAAVAAEAAVAAVGAVGAAGGLERPVAAASDRGSTAGAGQHAAAGGPAWQVGRAARDLRDLRDLVVYADADVVVVRKPAGVLSVPFERGDHGTLLDLARVQLRRIAAAGLPGSAVAPGRTGLTDPAAAGGRSAAGRSGGSRAPGGTAFNPTLRAVQRLDRDTSGLLVFARNVAAQRHLQRQLAERLVSRRYLALAHGRVRDAIHDTWLVADRGDGLRGSLHLSPGALRVPQPDARRAVTRVRVLAALRGATQLECELETGRQHQIRIHLAESGHPLIGETVYIRDYRGPRIAAPRPMLHAAVLAFDHPRHGRRLSFEDPPPADFLEVLRRLQPV